MTCAQIEVKGQGSAVKAITCSQGLLLFNSVMGQTYPAKEICQWLIKAGSVNVRNMTLHKAPSSRLVVGAKST